MIYRNNNDNYYNDFGDDDNDNNNNDENNSKQKQQQDTMMNLLNARIGISKLKEEHNNHRIQQNILKGNWSVRGFTLDKYDSTTNVIQNPQQQQTQQQQQQDPRFKIESSSLFDDPVQFMLSQQQEKQQQQQRQQQQLEESDVPIIVTKIVTMDVSIQDESIEQQQSLSPIIAIGRSNGSVLIMKLGTEYIAQFQSVPSIDMNDDTLTINYQSKLIRAEDNPAFPDSVAPSSTSEDVSNLSPSINKEETEPFEIIHQFQTKSATAITSMLFVDGTDLYISFESSNEVQRWYIHNDGEYDGTTPTQPPRFIMSYRSSSNDNGNTIIGIHYSSTKNQLITVSSEGIYYIWDHDTGKLIKQINVGRKIISCIFLKEKDILLLGLDNGYIIGYKSLDQEEEEEEPCVIINFLAHQGKGYTPDGISFVDGSSITSMECFISETIQGGTNRSIETITLITGSHDGLIKQWELYPRSLTKYEHWPRISTQRLKNREHILDGHDDQITSIAMLSNNNILISSSNDGRIIVWDSQNGKESLYRMDGFISQITSLCYIREQSLLITNGMDNVVCLHDFDNAPSDDMFSNEYNLEF